MPISHDESLFTTCTLVEISWRRPLNGSSGIDGLDAENRYPANSNPETAATLAFHYTLLVILRRHMEGLPLNLARSTNS